MLRRWCCGQATERRTANCVGYCLAGEMRVEKGQCELHWNDIAEHSEGMLAGLVPHFSNRPTTPVHLRSAPFRRFLRTRFRDIFADRGYLLCELHRGVDDGQRIERLRDLSLRHDVPLLAAGDVHYHAADRMLLHDCVTAIRHGTTIDHVHAHRFANSQRHLRSLGKRFANFIAKCLKQ